MKKTVVSNQKGGVGKTAIAVHLAQYMEEQAKRALVIDLDPQGNSSKTLRPYDTGLTASSLFTGELASIPSEQGIALVRADDKLADLERGNPQQIIPAFKKTLEAVSADFDYCVVDTRPSAGLLLSAALIAADFVLSPIELDDYSIDGITKMLQTIFGIKQRFNPQLAFLGMLPNRLNSHSAAQKVALDELLTKYAQYMVPARIGNRSSIPEALRAGVPVWRLKKSSAKDAGLEMLEAFRIIMERIDA
jgi:chromosome partitioning protein